MNPWLCNLLFNNSGGSSLPATGQTFYASLKTSLVPEVGTGGPTWSRATAAWRFNDLGYLRQIPSGCADFGGARLVTNLCPTPSNTLAVAGTKTVTLTAAATLQFSMGAGTGTATFSGTGGATGTLAAGASRVSVNKTVTAGTFVVTASVADLVDLSIVDVTGRDASYVPEYVSVGVLSAPYHGAGVDGSKYFTTDWQGAPIPVANLTRLRKESSATNSVRFSRNLYGSTYGELGSSSTPKVWIPSTTGSSIVTNGTFDTDLTGWTNNASSSASAVSGKMRIDSTGGNGGRYQDLTLTVGKTYYITADVTLVSGSGTMALTIYGSAALTGEVKTTWLFSSGSYGTIFKATAVTQRLYLSAISSLVADFDDVVVKECSCVPERTATGLDGIANSASTLTATSADAIILQPTSGIASAARCASVYVRRKTGTGTISFTQDGGSTWADITSQLNSTTYTRVQITSTLANPSVGFKISTSGDAIEVDCVQNEAGSVATSPIVTTTATVTRNADSLTYQTSGNIDFAVGTLFHALKTSGSLTTRYGLTIGEGLSYVNSTMANTSWASSDWTTAVIKTGLDDMTAGVVKRAAAWGGATQRVTGNGQTPGSGAFDGSFGNGATITLGTSLNGYIGDVAIYNYQMTDAELQAITT